MEQDVTRAEQPPECDSLLPSRGSWARVPSPAPVWFPVTDPIPMPRVIQKEVIVPASLAEVWDAWTTVPGVTSFLALKAKLELAIELRWPGSRILLSCPRGTAYADSGNS